MKQLPTLILFCAIVLFFGDVSAHRSGEVVVELNGEFVKPNTMAFSTGKTQLKVAADRSPQNFLVNRPVTFSVSDKYVFDDTGKRNGMKFRWSFGDNTSDQEGEAVTHIYKKPGSYIATVLFKYPTENEYYPKDTVLIHILPTAVYEFPSSVISVDNRVVDRPQLKSLPVREGELIRFDASESVGDGLSFKWDFGDGSQSEGARVTHAYELSASPTHKVILRVTDKNNIASDSAVYVQVQEGKRNAISLGYLDRFIGFLKSLIKTD